MLLPIIQGGGRTRPGCHKSILKCSQFLEDYHKLKPCLRYEASESETENLIVKKPPIDH